MEELAKTFLHDYPTTIELVQRIGAPFIALVAAFIAGAIAYRQWKTAHDKLRLDLFEKRYAVYSELRSVLATTLQQGTISYEEVMTFYRNFRGAEFLFGDEIEKYLEQIKDSLIKVSYLVEQISGDQNLPNREAQINEAYQIKASLEKELMSTARSKFKKYLSFGHLK